MFRPDHAHLVRSSHALSTVRNSKKVAGALVDFLRFV